MKRLLIVFIFLGLSLLGFSDAPTSAPRPNIVFILLDDLGYGDLSIHGCEDFKTPNMDSIAEQGMRFADAYVTCPVCAPSRAGMMSGRWQDRFGFRENPAPNAHWGLPLTESTLADTLKSAGYRTAIFGKWHIGEDEGYRPLDRGFDEFYGFLSGMHSYWKANDPFWGPIVEGDAQPAPLEQYLTFELADRGVDFIKRSAQEPFFLFLSFNAPHTPMQAPKKYLRKASHIEDEMRRTCAAMVMALDDAVGDVLDAIRSEKIEEKTVVVLMSDNGGALIPGSSQNGADNGPLRGSKAQLWEGGVRVPFFVKWPGTVPAGTVNSTPVISLDLFPTFGSLAGAELPPDLDGVDLWSLIQGKGQTLPERGFFWRFYDTQSAVRFGDIKWTRVDAEQGLFDLASDIGESENLIEKTPEILQQLRQRWKKWHSKNGKPIELK